MLAGRLCLQHVINGKRKDVNKQPLVCGRLRNSTDLCLLGNMVMWAKLVGLINSSEYIFLHMVFYDSLSVAALFPLIITTIFIT